MDTRKVGSARDNGITPQHSLVLQIGLQGKWTSNLAIILYSDTRQVGNAVGAVCGDG